MENLSQNTVQSIEFLIYATIIMLIIVTVFLVKLLVDMSNLTRSLQNLVLIVKHDIGPTIKELKRALININSIADSTEAQFKGFNKTLSGLNIISGSSQEAFSRAGIIISSLKQGFFTGLKSFFKKNKV